MKPNDKAYQAAINAFYMTRAEAEHEPNIVCMRRAVDAAYAAQFQSEDYAGLVKDLREWDYCWPSHKIESAVPKAADALETVLAERDEWEERQKATADILKYVEKERDEWKRLCGVRAQENDALKAENESMSQSLPLWAHKQMAANSALIERLRAERDALAARLAPVEDEALVEIAVRTHYGKKWDDQENGPGEAMKEVWRNLYRKPLAAIRPHIEAAERERCAKIAEHLNGWGSDFGKGGHAMHIAAAIRSEK